MSFSQKKTEFTGAKIPANGDPQAAPSPEAVPATTSPETAAQLSEFYAALVQTTGERWALSSDLHAEETLLDATTDISEKARQASQATVLPPAQPYPKPAGPPTRAESQLPGPQVVLPESNVGYKLLKKAGWSEGRGLGAREQGTQEPVQVDKQQGNLGIGFAPRIPLNYTPKGQKQSQQGARGSAGGIATATGRGAGGLGQKRALPADELALEDIDTKVKRVTQVMQAEADDKAGKEIARYVYGALSESAGSGSTHDVNPLLKRNQRLSARNPLL